MRLNESIDTTDSLGANIYVNFKETEIFRVLPKSNVNINEHIITDKCRFSYDSNSNNRIKNVFKFYSKTNQFKLSKWLSFFNEVDFGLKSGKTFSLVVSENIDLLGLNLLKKLERFFKGVKVYVHTRTFDCTNINIFRLNDSIKDIYLSESICFVLMINPKTECSLLNARLRVQSRNSLLSIFSLGQYMSTNLFASFVFLNIEKFIRIFEGKDLSYSDLLIKSQAPFFLIGDSIYSKLLNILNILVYISSINNSLRFLKVGLNSNSEGVRFVNIKPFNRSNLNLKSSYFLAVDLDDIFDIRKYLTLANKTLL